jgi:UDP-3-O-[3-hydroxymyristoyl] glucosamine N-acyltransferase
MLAGQVGIASHLNLGNKVVLLAQSGVTKSLKPGYYFGTPAKELKTAHKLEAHVRRLPEYSDRIRVLEKEINQLKEQLSKKR